MSHRRLIALSGMVAAIILLVYTASLIQTDINFATTCLLYPEREWLLCRPDLDTFETQLFDRRHEDQRKIDLYKSERGDVIQFSLIEGVSPGSQIRSGQEVACISSLDDQVVLEQLHPRLLEAEAELRQARTGAKEEILQQARSVVAAAEARLAGATAVFDRTRRLFTEGLCSQADFDRDRAEFIEAQADLESFASSLRVLETGEKSAVIDAWQARVDLLHQQIKSAEESIAAGIIRSGISGEVVTLNSDSVLVRVADLDTLYAVAPISPIRVERLGIGQTTYISGISTTQGDIAGRVVRIDRMATVYAGRSYFWATVAIPNPDQTLAAGSLGQIRFRGKRVSLLVWLMDHFANASDQLVSNEW